MPTIGQLTAGTRAALPKKAFGLPGERKYPMPDPSHAANAKARATQQVKAGNLSESAAQQIRSKANAILGEKPKAKRETYSTFKAKNHPGGK